MKALHLQSHPCVIDPMLALSHQGVFLIKHLGRFTEVWIPRELWHILNNVPFYSQQLSLVAPSHLVSFKTPDQERMALAGTLWALKEWEKMRWETDLCGLNLFWLGDSLGESFLPKHQPTQLFQRWEIMTRSLDDYLEQQHLSNSILHLALRDTISLAASLNSAMILSYQLQSELNEQNPPTICKMLETWGMPCYLLTAEDTIVATERTHFQQVLVQAGLAKLVWAGLRLVVLHLFAPTASTTCISLSQSQSNSTSEIESSPWIGTQGFWYQI